MLMDEFEREWKELKKPPLSFKKFKRTQNGQSYVNLECEIAFEAWILGRKERSDSETLYKLSKFCEELVWQRNMLEDRLLKLESSK